MIRYRSVPLLCGNCATSRKLLFVEISFDTPFLYLSFQLHCLDSIGTGKSFYQNPRPALGCILFTTTIVGNKSFFNIVSLTHIIPVGRFTEQYINYIIHYFKRPSRPWRDTLPDLSRSFAGTAPHPENYFSSRYRLIPLFLIFPSNRTASDRSEQGYVLTNIQGLPLEVYFLPPLL